MRQDTRPLNLVGMGIGRGTQALLLTLRNRYLSFSLRLVLGGILLTAGLGKLPDVQAFSDLVNKLGILPWPWIHYYALVLPWAELVIGVCLILGAFLTLAAGASLLMTLSFLVGNVVSIVRHPDEASCGCFGPMLLVPPWAAFTVDLLMAAMATLIVLRSGNILGFDSLLSKGLRNVRKGRPG